MQLRKEGNRFFATLDGGIFSNPKGTLAGIVFGAARTRQGKLVTARRKVDPSNPNTAAQQEQRTKFSEAQFIVRSLGVDIYQSDFNRSIGQLPGFQSMQSIYIKQIDASFELNLVTNINLGTLPKVTGLGAAAGSAGQIDVSWTGGQSSPATTDDVIVILAVATTAANRALSGGIVVNSSEVRDSEVVTVSGLLSGVEYQMYVYARGAGTAEGLLSVTQIVTGTSGS
jgi:hypothetical protein